MEELSWYPDPDVPMSEEEKQYRLKNDMPLLDTRGWTVGGVSVIRSRANDERNSLEELRRRVRKLESRSQSLPVMHLFGLYW